ncbi:MAG TPA: acyltransferase [Polyangiaceae bacterium]|nr:acyltransferase [Polyangiaceae bacterium]
MNESLGPNVGVHPTAVIDEGVTVGTGTKIWHFCHLSSGARIGARCVLGQNCFVAGSVVVGDGCRIQNNVSLYDGVVLEDEVFVGPSAVFTNVMNPRAAIRRHTEFRPTRVCRGATIGANATIVAGVTLGSYCFIGAGCVVTHDVLPFALMVGVPAVQLGWMSRAGERLTFQNESGLTRCPTTGEAYRLAGGQLELAEDEALL